jgi:aspartate carbamoyltransferase catalytic subunit
VNLLRVADLGPEGIRRVLQRATNLAAGTKPQRLGGAVLLALLTPSTRTRLGFARAAVDVGAVPVMFEATRNAPTMSAPETLEDSLASVADYYEVIVLRTAQYPATLPEGSASIISAGLGQDEHPTQALIDLFSVQRELGRIEGLRWGFVGDLDWMRVVRSLLRALVWLDPAEVRLMAPPGRRPSPELLNDLPSSEAEPGDVEGLDVLYVAGLPPGSAELALDDAARRPWRVGPETMARLAPGARVLCPLPRVDEIDPEVDADPRSAWFRQSAAARFVRTAILEACWSGHVEEDEPRPSTPVSKPAASRSAYRQLLERKLGKRGLVYFGTRGADARSLSDLKNFECIFSQVAPSGLAGVEEVCLESVTSRRVDLDSYSIDADGSKAVSDLRAEMLRRFEALAAVIPYRAGAVLASAWFPRSDKVLHLGNFHELQDTFEHKPWVESQLSAAGVRTIPWRYFADNERPLIKEMLENTPLVVRSNRSDGGTGVRFIQSAEELDRDWPPHTDGFVATAPFVEGLPININAVVFPDGAVSRHGVSVQLVGIEGCTRRRFGYCGNDFAAAATLDDGDIEEIDTTLDAVAAWLARHGYRGAFGMDAILSEHNVFVVEVNPRFQGSSRLSAVLDSQSDRADIFLAHIGAFLNLPPPDDLASTELLQRPLAAHIVVHASDARVVEESAADAPPPGFDVDLLSRGGVTVEAGAILADLVTRCPVTVNGTSLSESARSAAEVWNA